MGEMTNFAKGCTLDLCERPLAGDMVNEVTEPSAMKDAEDAESSFCLWIHQEHVTPSGTTWQVVSKVLDVQPVVVALDDTLVVNACAYTNFPRKNSGTRSHTHIKRVWCARDYVKAGSGNDIRLLDELFIHG